MEAVGSEVIVAIMIPIVAIGVIVALSWKSIKEYVHRELSPDVRIEQNQQERRRREGHVSDQVCSICLQQPKKYEVSSTCGHSFCAECIFSLYHQQNLKIKCPLCRLEVNILFKIFEGSDETRDVEQQLRDYNTRFDDNRSIIRTIKELPYVFQRIKKFVCSAQFIVFFLRSMQLIRMLFLITVYLLMPFDLIPEHVIGVIGYIDDILVGLLIIAIFVAIVAIQYVRVQH